MEPTAIGWNAEQWSCSRPGRMASLERAPPPISSAASSTVTCTPSRARATAAASPLGPPPTTIAVLMTVFPSRHRARALAAPLAAAGPGHLGRDRPVGQPRLLADRVRHLPRAALGHAERRVDDLVVLDLAVDGLRLHPHDDQLARLEPAPALHRGDQVLIVQVTVAEVEPDQRVADELTLAHRPRVDVLQVLDEQREQAAALAVHGPPRDCLLHRDLRDRPARSPAPAAGRPDWRPAG